MFTRDRDLYVIHDDADRTSSASKINTSTRRAANPCSVRRFARKSFPKRRERKSTLNYRSTGPPRYIFVAPIVGRAVNIRIQTGVVATSSEIIARGVSYTINYCTRSSMCPSVDADLCVPHQHRCTNANVDGGGYYIQSHAGGLRRVFILSFRIRLRSARRSSNGRSVSPP